MLVPNTLIATAKSLQSFPTWDDPIPGILQARTLEWVAIPSPMHESESEVAQSCPTLHDPMDCSLPGSSVHVIFQTRVLEWVPLPSLNTLIRSSQNLGI